MGENPTQSGQPVPPHDSGGGGGGQGRSASGRVPILPKPRPQSGRLPTLPQQRPGSGRLPTLPQQRPGSGRLPTLPQQRRGTGVGHMGAPQWLRPTIDPYEKAESRKWLVWLGALMVFAWLVPVMASAGRKTEFLFVWKEVFFPPEGASIPFVFKFLVAMPLVLGVTYLGMTKLSTARARAMGGLFASAGFLVVLVLFVMIEMTGMMREMRLPGLSADMIAGGFYGVCYQLVLTAAFLLMISGAVARKNAPGTSAGSKLSLIGAICGGLGLVLPMNVGEGKTMWIIELLPMAFKDYNSEFGMLFMREAPNYKIAGVIMLMWLTSYVWVAVESIMLSRSRNQRTAAPTRILTLSVIGFGMMLLGLAAFVGQMGGGFFTIFLVLAKISLMFGTHNFGMAWGMGKLIALNHLDRAQREAPPTGGDGDSMGQSPGHAAAPMHPAQGGQPPLE